MSRFVNISKEDKIIGRIVQDNGNTYAEPISAEYKDELNKLIKPYETMTGGNIDKTFYDARKIVKPNEPLWLDDLSCVIEGYYASLPFEGSGDNNNSTSK